MSNDDIVKIKVDRQRIGIRGLRQVMGDMAGEYGEKPDEEVRAELLRRLSKKNYIPDPVKENYSNAFLREFKKFLGKPYDEIPSRELEIKVLGPGCARCDRLEREVMEIMSEMNIAGDLEHVRDIKEIGSYGVMGTPALIINGKVLAVGSVPPRNKIKKWLLEATA